MLRKISQSSKILCINTIKNHSFSKFKNTKEVEILLEKFKKDISKDSLNEIFNANKSLKPIHLFRINGFTKVFFLVSRYQIMAYCIGGGLYTLYIIPSKWQKLNEQEKSETLTKRELKEIENNRLKIILGSLVLILSASFGCYISKIMGRRFIKNINWLQNEKMLEFQFFSFFGFTKYIKCKPSEIEHLIKPRRFDSTIQWKFSHPKEGFELLSTKGTGSWSNKYFFEFLVNSKYD